MIKKIEIPIYFGMLVIIQKKKLTDIPKKWKPDNFDVYGFGALSYYKDSKGGYRRYIIAFQKDVNARMVAHEALHCVNHMFHHKNIQYDTLNDEHAAYLIGWIVGECHLCLKIKKMK